MLPIVPLSETEIAQSPSPPLPSPPLTTHWPPHPGVDATAAAVAADFDAQYAGDAHITALHTYLTTAKNHDLTLSETRRFLAVLRRYILRQTRHTEEHLLKEKSVSGLDAKRISAEEVRGMALNPALLRVMVKSEFGGDGGMVGKANQLELDIAQWGVTAAGAEG